MKEKIKHYMLILLGLFTITGGISVFLNNASYNPDFSVIDMISGVTKKKNHDDENQDSSKWEYTLDDLSVTNENYKEITISVNGSRYKVLENSSKIEDSKTIILLSNQGNTEYQEAILNIASDLEKEGYQVSIQKCSETMMLSLVHAGHFDLFLMSEEDENEKME